MPFAPYSDLVSVKLFKADPVRGEVISVLRAPPGVELPRFHHSGTATIYTVQDAGNTASTIGSRDRAVS